MEWTDYTLLILNTWIKNSAHQKLEKKSFSRNQLFFVSSFDSLRFFVHVQQFFLLSIQFLVHNLLAGQKELVSKKEWGVKVGKGGYVPGIVVGGLETFLTVKGFAFHTNSLPS